MLRAMSERLSVNITDPHHALDRALDLTESLLGRCEALARPPGAPPYMLRG